MDPQADAPHLPALRKVLRARARLMVCFWTLPVYIPAVWALLDNRQGVAALMYVYMALWAAFAVDMARRRCPACGGQFYVRSVLLDLSARRCVHCGLGADAPRPPEPPAGG